jgi:hypothetical protein
MNLTIFGFHQQLNPGQAFLTEHLKIPHTLLKNNVSVVQTMLNQQKVVDKIEVPLTAYIQTTNPEMRIKID